MFSMIPGRTIRKSNMAEEPKIHLILLEQGAIKEFV